MCGGGISSGDEAWVLGGNCVRCRNDNLAVDETTELEGRVLTRHEQQVALLPVSPVFLVVVRTAPVRPLSVTCAVVDACSLLPRSGASGTSRSTRDRSRFCDFRLCQLAAATNRL